jgi:hypothetical protein
MLYTCNTCKKTFNQKYNYNIHLNRKTKCSIESKINLENKLFECDKCNERFTAISNLYRHRKLYCKGVPIKNDSEQTNNNSNQNENLILYSNSEPELLSESNLELESKININEINKLNEKMEQEKNKIGYFYIILQEKYLNNNLPIYNVGISNKKNKKYSKMNIKFLEIEVKNPLNFKGIITDFFKHKFKNELVYGDDYFSGDINHMIYAVNKINEIYNIKF